MAIVGRWSKSCIIWLSVFGIVVSSSNKQRIAISTSSCLSFKSETKEVRHHLDGSFDRVQTGSERMALGHLVGGRRFDTAVLNT